MQLPVAEKRRTRCLHVDDLVRDAEFVREFERPRFPRQEAVRPSLHDEAVLVQRADLAAEDVLTFHEDDGEVGPALPGRLFEIPRCGEPGDAPTDDDYREWVPVR